MLNIYLESWNNYDFYQQKISNQKQIIDSLKLSLKEMKFFINHKKLVLQDSLKRIMILTMQIIFY